jgi:hypothetical protein
MAEHKEHHEHKEPRGRMDNVKRWLGLGAVILSTGSAAVGVLRAQADMSDRSRVVVEQLAAGRLQQKAQDYSNAWASFQRAAEVAAADGPIATLLGGSGRVQADVRTAQQDLAMEWLRSTGISSDPPFTEVVDKAVPTLSAAVDGATSTRKADILAHIGWAYYLKQRDGDTHVDPVGSYRDAVAADAGNPYANAFWGLYLLWNHGRPWQTGPVPEAQQHFAAAFASGREHALVRRLQLTALLHGGSDEAEAAWWQTVDEMRKGGEPIDATTEREMVRSYFVAPNSDHQVERLLSLLPAVEHVELQRMLLQSGKLDAQEILAIKANMAIALGAAGKAEAALATWREVKAGAQPDRSYNFSSRMDAALRSVSTTGRRGH